MNVGFDADGVLFDIESFQLSEKIIKYMKDKYNINIVNKNGYGIKEIFNCSEKIEKEVWIKFGIEYSLFYKSRPWIKETIDELRKNGNKVYIVTSKACTTEKSVKGLIMRNLFELGLKFNQIHVDGIEYCSVENSPQDKLSACKKRNIKIIVEDKKENIEYLSKHLKVICVNTLNNKDVKEFDENRVTDGNEIYFKINKIICEMKNKKNIFTSFEKKKEECLELGSKNDYYNDLIKYYKCLPYNIKKIETSEFVIRNLSKIIATYFNKKYKPTIIGLENLPKEKGYIYFCNYLDDKDLMFLLAQLRTKLQQWHPFITKEEINELIKIIFSVAISVFKEKNVISDKNISTNELAKHIVNGYNILLMPESKMDLKDFSKNNHVYLSQTLQCPIVNLAFTKDQYKNPVLRIDKPYIVPREMSLKDAIFDSNARLKSLEEKNNKLILKR